MARRSLAPASQSKESAYSAASSMLIARPSADVRSHVSGSQADLARFLSVSRQIVNQNLREWLRHGWVDLGNSRIVIRNPEALRRVVDAG